MSKSIAITFLFSFLLNGFASAQGQEYDDLIARADSLYKVKRYMEAGMTYTAAFNTLAGKAYPDDRYNAARAWAMAGVADSAMYHLEYMANKKVLSRSEVIFAD